MKKFLPLLLICTAFIISSCTAYKDESYSEPLPSDKVAKVTFAYSKNFNSSTAMIFGVFSMSKTEGNYLNNTETKIKFDEKTKDRNFGIPTPNNSEIAYNVYIPANKTFKFNASIWHYWYSNLSDTSGEENRSSLCSYDNIVFTPVEGGEYLVFLDNLNNNYKDAPRCSLTIKQFVKSKSGNQWVDIQYTFKNTNGRDVMTTYSR